MINVRHNNINIMAVNLSLLEGKYSLSDSDFFYRAGLLKPTLITVQSTLGISKSKGSSKTVRDIRTSTYQICSIEDKTI